MKVTLVSYTQGAVDLLLATKSTRLSDGEDISTWSDDKKLEHLMYMRDTIKSSWEFVDYVFLIEGVSRAMTHQLVRTRTASFAQQAQRVVDVRESGWVLPDIDDDGLLAEFDNSMLKQVESYANLIESGMAVQDARGVLPNAMETNIFVKANLRTMASMAELRLCTRTQGEYQRVFRVMRDLVIGVHPWASEFINVYCVNTGVCCFPRFKECPLREYVIPDDQLAVAKKRLKSAFESTPVWESNPVPFMGKTTG